MAYVYIWQCLCHLEVVASSQVLLTVLEVVKLDKCVAVNDGWTTLIHFVSVDADAEVWCKRNGLRFLAFDFGDAPTSFPSAINRELVH